MPADNKNPINAPRTVSSCCAVRDLFNSIVVCQNAEIPLVRDNLCVDKTKSNSLLPPFKDHQRRKDPRNPHPSPRVVNNTADSYDSSARLPTPPPATDLKGRRIHSAAKSVATAERASRGWR